MNELQSQALVRSFLPLQRSHLLLLLSALLSQLRQVLLIHLRRQQTRSDAHVEVIQTGNRKHLNSKGSSSGEHERPEETLLLLLLRIRSSKHLNVQM